MIYDVTFTRYGCAYVEANSMEEALKKADSLSEDEVSWNDNWTPTDAYAMDETNLQGDR